MEILCVLLFVVSHHFVFFIHSVSFWLMVILFCVSVSFLCRLCSITMSRRLMSDFLNLEENAVIHGVTEERHPTKQQSNLVLTPNELGDLTPFGINKVLNKELPVVLQVIDIMEDFPTAKEKITLTSPGGTTTYFFADTQSSVGNAARSKIVLPDGNFFFEEEGYVSTRPVFPLLHVSDGVHFIQAIIRKHPLAKKCFSAGLKCGSIVVVTKARTSYFRGSIGLLEIYDFNVHHLNFQVLGSPVPFPDTTIDFFKDCSTKLSWTTYPMTYSGLPGVRLISGKWILEEDDNSADDITTLMTMRSQFINSWTSKASKKQKTEM
jgi:hypothetical protein